MKSTLLKSNFNGGELSPFLDGRPDFPKYPTGCKEMTNFVPTVYGPMTKRPGTIFVEDLTEEAVLYPFEFSETQAYIFAFKESEIAIYTGDGRLLDGVTPVSIPAFYTLAQAKELKFAQSGDLIYFTHNTAGIFKISRTAVDTFVGEQFETINGPFQDENLDETVTLTVNGSATTITCTEAIFTPEAIGSSIQIGYIPATEFSTWEADTGNYSVGDYLQYLGNIYQVTAGTGLAGTRAPQHEKGSKSDGKITLTYVSNGYGYAKITAVGGDPSTTATVEVIKTFPPLIVGGNATDEWSWSAFGGGFGWPTAIVFHQQRMVLGGSLEQPQTIWGSVQGDIEDFQEGTDDEDSYEFTVAANKKNPIVWLASNVTLNAGTLGSEFIVGVSGSSITPTNISIEQVGQYGSAQNMSPLIANGFTVFGQSGGRKLRELRYDYDSERNYARDLNKVAEHIADAGIKQIAYQAEPYQIIWTVIGDELYALTYETDEEVFAWSRQDCGEIVSIATIPNGAYDRLWVVVKREGNYYIEYLSDFFRRDNSIDDACFVDSSLMYSGPEIQTLTGLDHLEGETVEVLNNGSVGQSQVVSGGQITLQFPTTKCTVGLPIKSAWQSMRFEGGAKDGVGQGKSKSVSKVIFRLEATGAGFTYGKGNIDKEFENGIFTELPIRNTNDNMDSPPSLLHGDTQRQGMSGGSDAQYMLRIEHSDPTPCTIIAIILEVDTVQ